MAGATQRLYRHDLPKTRAAVGPRINLTFRWIEPR
jgi:alkylated DNA repair dioxygenase AlkB